MQTDIVGDLVSRASRAGLSMATLCKRAGVAPSTPSRWRSGAYEPAHRTIRKMMAVLAEEEAKLHAEAE